jgi:hypothetical protein
VTPNLAVRTGMGKDNVYEDDVQAKEKQGELLWGQGESSAVNNWEKTD